MQGHPRPSVFWTPTLARGGDGFDVLGSWLREMCEQHASDAGGPACALEATLDDQPKGSEREAIAKALDRDVEVAFAEAAERIESTQGALQAKRVRAAIEAWKQDEPRPKRHRRH